MVLLSCSRRPPDLTEVTARFDPRQSAAGGMVLPRLVRMVLRYCSRGLLFDIARPGRMGPPLLRPVRFCATMKGAFLRRTPCAPPKRDSVGTLCKQPFRRPQARYLHLMAALDRLRWFMVALVPNGNFGVEQVFGSLTSLH